MDLHCTFTPVSVRYTSVGSPAGLVMAVQVDWVMAVQVRSAVHFPGLRLELTTLKNGFLVKMKNFTELCLGLEKKL